MTTLYASVHYWLVDHPIVSRYEWIPGQTPGASRLFLAVTIATYLSATLLLRHCLTAAREIPALRFVAAAHNAALCLLSLIMAAGCTLSILHQTPPENPLWSVCFPGGGATAARGPTFFWGHVFYLSKILEFVDTLLILLGGPRSRRRLSFLHVYHHAAVPVMCYWWLESAQSLFPVGIVTNSAVHVVMYAYYFMAALGLRPWWKRAVTDCQITQFLFGYPMSGLMLYMHFTTASGCSGVRVWGFNAMFTTSLLALFINFHAKNYGRKTRAVDQGGFDKDKRS